MINLYQGELVVGSKMLLFECKMISPLGESTASYILIQLNHRRISMLSKGSEKI